MIFIYMLTYSSKDFGKIIIDRFDIVVEKSVFKKIIYNPELFYELAKVINHDTNDMRVTSKYYNRFGLMLLCDGKRVMLSPDNNFACINLYDGIDGIDRKQLNDYLMSRRDYFYEKSELFADLITPKNKRVQ